MVVFDMAGTTVDENNVVYKTLQKAINNFGYGFSLAKVMEIGAGKEKLNAIKDIIASAEHGDIAVHENEIYDSFIDELALAYDSFTLKPQPGAEELFEILRSKNIIVVLNTGYNRATAVSILGKLGWREGAHIDALVTASDTESNRPDPDMILLAMKKFNIRDAAEVIKVGDSAIDIEEGKNAGCGLSIGITTGAHSYEQLLTAKPDYIINHLTELIPII
jgi:phosphonatase-like hydrolase